MKSIVLDTNVFLRLILNDVPAQVKSVEEIFKNAKEEKTHLIVPQIIIFEIAFVLSKYYQINKEEIIDKLASILATPFIDIENRDVFQQALNLFKTSSLSFVDCFLLCFARSKDSKLFTFDKDLQKLID